MKRRTFIAGGLLLPASFTAAAPIAVLGGPGRLIVAEGGEPGPEPAGVYYGGPDVGSLTPTMYAAPTAQGTGDGSSEANARTLSSALAAATAGAIVGVLPGVYTKSGSGERYAPAWGSTNNGSSGNPIIIVAKYSAIDLAGKASADLWTTDDLAAVFAHGDRSELRHTGTGTDGGGSGGPAFGCLDRNDVWWIGFCTDEAQAAPRRDTGATVLWGAERCRITRCVLYGRPSNYTTYTYDNHPGVRLEGSTDCLVGDNVIYGFSLSNSGAVSGTHNHCGVQRYDCVGTVVEHNHTFGNHTGIYLKDQEDARDETVRFNLSADVVTGMEILNVNESSADVNNVYQNLIVGASGNGIVLQSAGYNIQVHHNTVVVPASSFGSSAAITAHYAGTGCYIRNNIFVGTSGAAFIDQQYRDTSIVPSNHNRFFRSGTQFGARFDGSSYSGLSAWQSATGQDSNSSVGDPLFVGGGDYRLQAGSPCLTMSDTSGPVGCYITGTEIIGPRYAT